ncbi:hypothetical protein CASFOL_032249 [Castilleja foliolosa]|uniref:Replication protein A subunit n=1 Tax=Castilleja foliolosa TaxID=1961234 RepID=A0ABD3C1T6_9LAMI
MRSSNSVNSSLYVHFSQVEGGKNMSGVKVRVIRIYQVPAQKSDNVGSWEMVLHDETGNRMHASMKCDVYQEKDLNIIEGCLYKIKIFIVGEYRHNYKTTTNPRKLMLIRQTSVTYFEDNDFPRYMHNFREIHEIVSDINVDDYELLDVIGRVVSYQPPTLVPSVATKRMDVKLADTENREITFSLWGEHIQPVLENLEKQDSKPKIVCVQFARINRFRNTELKIATTFYITKVTVNGDSDIFKDFLNRMSREDIKACSQIVTEEDGDEIYTLFAKRMADVKSLRWLTDIKKASTYWVDGTIMEIESTGACWYNACKNCQKKLHGDGRVLRCSTCGEANYIDNYRYKIEVMVGDSSGFAATFLLWNTQCVTLIGKTAAKMKQLSEHSSTLIPKAIKEALIDKRALFEVNAPPVKGNRPLDYYTAQRVTIDQEILDIYGTMYTGSQHSTTGGKDVEDGIEVQQPSKKDGKGKEKVGCEEIVELAAPDKDPLNAIECVHSPTKNAKGKEKVGAEDVMPETEEQIPNSTAIEDLPAVGVRKDSSFDAKYSSKSKKLKIKQEK